LETIDVTIAKQQKYWRIAGVAVSMVMALLLGLSFGLSGCTEGTSNVAGPPGAIPPDSRTAESRSRNFMAKLGYEEIDEMPMVTIEVPPLPGKFDIWCYEDQLGRPVAHTLDAGILTLTHRLGKAIVTTQFTPAEDGVKVLVEVTGPDAESVKAVESLNPCWQFRRAESFQNRGDYVEDFVARCFVILENGLTFMKDTRRIPGTRADKTDKANLPRPWIQEYYPVWREHPGQIPGRRGNSLDRPVYPLIGCISRDGKYLAAFAWPETARLGQVWHDCLHPRPVIGESYDPKTNRIVSRARIYFRENDEEALIAAFKRDFPNWKRPVSACN